MHIFFLAAALVTILAQPANAIPYFARKYGVTCSQCHLVPAKLNEYGEGFVAGGYRAPELVKRRTWPFALWLSGRSESLPGDQAADDYRAYPNRVELISGDAVTSWLSYFVEWRALSNESRGNGTLRDRSGRFEDLFLVMSHGNAELTIGQFRLLGQVDVSRRLSLSEPLVFSSGLPGTGTGTRREIGLRGFSSAGRSPAVRASWTIPRAPDTRWVTAVSIPVPGELSIPLTDSARVQASNEIEFAAKGVFFETFVRRGLSSLGAHLFYDESDRFLATAIATVSRGALHLGAALGVIKSGDVATGRWSLEAEAFPHRYFAIGARLENQANDNVRRAFPPYVNLHFPGTRYTVRLTVEQRVQSDRNATLLELGTVF